MAPLTIGILDGDDIGHEIVPAAVRGRARRGRAARPRDRLAAAAHRRAARSTRTAHTLPAGTLETLATLDGWILGPIGHRAYPEGARARSTRTRSCASISTCSPTCGRRAPIPDIGCLHDDVDLVIVRENNEGFQPDRNMVAGSGEFRPTDEVTLSVRVITRTGSRRVARAALELARQRRKHLTLVHKDTVFKLGCGMFVEECQQGRAGVSRTCAVDDVIVDTFAMRLVRDPQSFDVVVTTNMFGDILSDEAAGLVGGLGMAPGLCIGDGDVAMAQATHGSAPDIAGKGIANPYAMIESTAMLLDWLGRSEASPARSRRRSRWSARSRRRSPIPRRARATSAEPPARRR